MASPERAPVPLKLLLDVHHSPEAASRLRAAGWDVTAAAQDASLSSLMDDELLRAAARGERALVTENARDFDRIAREWAGRNERHAGIIFTSPRRFHRGSHAYPQSLIDALARFLTAGAIEGDDWVYWLE